jgi:hypothetical protein
MSTPPLLIRPVKLTTTLPEDVHGRLMLHLYSPGEGRVPKGAIQRFLVERITEFFSNYKEPPNGN